MNEEKKDANTNETVSNQKPKTKRRFNWTPAKRAAFEKCIAARKQKLSNKEITTDKKPEPPPKIDSPNQPKSTKKENMSVHPILNLLHLPPPLFHFRLYANQN